MPDPTVYAAFLAAVAVLMLIPGPNVALIVANSVAYGPRFGLFTVAGTAAAMMVQLGVTTLGMSEVLGTLGSWFAWLRWVGVAYLVWLGMAQWRATAVDLTRTRPEHRSECAIITRAFLVSLTNPKTLLFYGAFFPQFVNPTRDAGAQVAILALSFIVMAVIVDGGWAVLAGRARGLLATRGRLRNRLSGGMLICAGVGLALARHK